MKFSYIILCIILVSGCSFSKKKIEIQEGTETKSFPWYKAPSISTTEDAIKQISLNFWNNYLDSINISNDTTLIGGIRPEEVAKAYIEYIRVLNNTSPHTRDQAQRKFAQQLINLKGNNPPSTNKDIELTSAKNKIIRNLLFLTDELLFGVNSIFRDEELYIPFIEEILKAPLLSEIEMERYMFDLEGLYLNRIGTKANNFTFYTNNGYSGDLESINAEYTIILFSNPGCTACLDIIGILKNSQTISSLIESKNLKILNLYIDENLSEWDNYISNYPTNWINAYTDDERIRNNQTYSIRAIPSIYLLDADKIVVLKDATPNTLIPFFDHINHK